MTVVIFGHLNCSFYIHTYLLTYLLTHIILLPSKLLFDGHLTMHIGQYFFIRNTESTLLVILFMFLSLSVSFRLCIPQVRGQPHGFFPRRLCLCFWGGLKHNYRLMEVAAIICRHIFLTAYLYEWVNIISFYTELYCDVTRLFTGEMSNTRHLEWIQWRHHRHYVISTCRRRTCWFVPCTCITH